MGRNPFREMLQTVRSLERLPEMFIDQAGPISIRLAAQGFEMQTDPYGEWWSPTVTGLSFDQRDGLKNALRLSNVRLRNLMVMNLDHHAFIFHQHGSVYAWGSIPARLMVPIVSRGLCRWAYAYHELARALWVQLIEKGRQGGEAAGQIL